jgi:hypothetical protein
MVCSFLTLTVRFSTEAETEAAREFEQATAERHGRLDRAPELVGASA